MEKLCSKKKIKMPVFKNDIEEEIQEHEYTHSWVFQVRWKQEKILVKRKIWGWREISEIMNLKRCTMENMVHLTSRQNRIMNKKRERGKILKVNKRAKYQKEI